MTIALGIIALVIALIGAFALPPDRAASTAKAGKFELIAVALIAVVLGGLAWRLSSGGMFGVVSTARPVQSESRDDISFALFLVLGLALAYVSDQFDRTGRWLVALALPIVACAFVSLSTGNREMSQLGLAGGLGLSGWLCSRNSGRSGAMAGAVLAAVVVAADALGARASTFDSNARLGSALGVVALIGFLVSSLAGRREKAGLIGGILLFFILVGGGFLVTAQYAKVDQGLLLFGGGVVAALVVHLLVPDDEMAGSFRALIAAIIWLGVATASFGLGKGQGMAVSALAGVATLIGIRNSRALLTISPLIAMVFYRWFRELHLDATRAIDIGQHYALIGVAVGALAPLLPIEWARLRINDAKSALGGACWIIALAVVPFAVAIVLGAKGEIGLAFGFGLSGVLAAAIHGSTLGALSLSAALSAVTVAVYGWLEPLLDLTRQEKVQHFGMIAAALVILAILIGLLSRNPEMETPQATT